MVNEIPTHTPLATLFFLAIKNHDDAEAANDENAMTQYAEEISAIEAAAIDRPPIALSPDIAHRICVARGLLGEVFDQHEKGGDVEAALAEIEKLLDNALSSFCQMTYLDLRCWGLDYYSPAISPRQAAEAA